LWVDRYCIDQADPQEKHNLISQMDKVYRGAELTIIAAAGKNPNHGLPGVNGTSRRRRIEFQKGNSSFVMTRTPWDHVAYSTWNRCGWTYQEVLLSPRRLYFTNWEILFECQSLSAQERTSEDATHDSTVYSWQLSDRSFREIYYQINEYRYRALTYPEDAIRGIEAILRSFQFTYQPSWPFGASEEIQTINHFYGVPCTSYEPTRNFNVPEQPTLGGRESQCLHRGYADISVMVMGDNQNFDTGNDEVSGLLRI
jgi:hypothetical protein